MSEGLRLQLQQLFVLLSIVSLQNRKDDVSLEGILLLGLDTLDVLRTAHLTVPEIVGSTILKHLFKLNHRVFRQEYIVSHQHIRQIKLLRALDLHILKVFCGQ